MKTYAIILASGTARRFNSGESVLKQFAKVAGRSLLEHTMDIFEKAEGVDETIVVITPGYRTEAENLVLRGRYRKVTRILEGGATRKQSSYIGLCSIAETEANVIIHDCARPLLSERIIRDCLQALQTYDAVDVAIPSADTIICVTPHGFIRDIPVRSQLMRGQTPQCFRLSLIRRAHELAADSDIPFTDDCSLVVRYNLAKVFVVAGDRSNMKITWPEDLHLADKFFQVRSEDGLSQCADTLQKLRGLAVVIFGGNSGIGRCIARRLTQSGALCCARSRRSGCNVASYDQVAAALESAYAQYGRIDAVIDCAGVMRLGKLEYRELQDIYDELKTNYLGPIHISRAAIPYLKKTCGSLLLFTSSSYTRGRAFYATYSSAKAGVVNFAQALAEELFQDGIRVNVINPARTDTPLRRQNFGSEAPGSLLSPDQVATSALLTLASSFTGQVIDVRL